VPDRAGPGRASLGLVLLLGAAACGAGHPGGTTSAGIRRPAATYRADGVTVTVALAPGAADPRRVAVTFTPDRPGFHLYSTALSRRREDGLGTATRVGTTGGLAVTGPMTASRPAHLLRIAALHVRLPVYPDGPVTVTVPVRRTGPPRAAVVVSYGACSARICLLPVTGHAIGVRLR
jgi:hypothetical protein